VAAVVSVSGATLVLGTALLLVRVLACGLAADLKVVLL
jgi:hypothetical protein